MRINKEQATAIRTTHERIHRNRRRAQALKRCIQLMVVLAVLAALWYFRAPILRIVNPFIEKHMTKSPAATVTAQTALQKPQEPEPMPDLVRPIPSPTPDEQEVIDDITDDRNFQTGMKLYRLCKSQYTQYQQTRSNMGVLNDIETRLHRAIDYFAKAAEQFPDDPKADTMIQRSYKMISDCHHSRQLQL